MAFYGVNQDVMVRELNLRFKLAIPQKGGVGLRTLKVIFKRMDFNGNKKLDSSEFEQALAAFGYVNLELFCLRLLVCLSICVARTSHAHLKQV